MSGVDMSLRLCSALIWFPRVNWIRWGCRLITTGALIFNRRGYGKIWKFLWKRELRAMTLSQSDSDLWRYTSARKNSESQTAEICYLESLTVWINIWLKVDSPRESNSIRLLFILFDAHFAFVLFCILQSISLNVSPHYSHDEEWFSLKQKIYSLKRLIKITKSSCMLSTCNECLTSCKTKLRRSQPLSDLDRR